MNRGKTLIQHNCKNGKYSIDGTQVKSLGYMTAVTLEPSIGSKTLYGDGEVQMTILSDAGLTGTLEMTAQDEDLEKDLGFLKEITQGLARVQVLQNKNISVGFETYVVDDTGITKTKRVWLLGVNVSPSSESLAQDTDTTNENTASYSITAKGVNLKDNASLADYHDSNGNTIKIFKITSKPGDTGYETFLDSVPVPTAKAS